MSLVERTVSEPLEYRKPGTRDGEQAVNVERRGDGSVSVGIHYPRKQRVETCIGVAICGVIAAALPMLGFVFESWGAAATGAFVAVPVLLVLLDVLRSAVSPQEWVASPEGLTIVRHVPWGAPHRRFIPRSKIRDVRLKFYRNGSDIRVRGRYLALLSAGPTLHGLGGDQVAQVANAVREGLGLPPVDWPSGRPRGTAAAAT